MMRTVTQERSGTVASRPARSKRVRELSPGDRTRWYEVLTYASFECGRWRVDVRYEDGGIGSRAWDDPDYGVMIVDVGASGTVA